MDDLMDQLYCLYDNPTTKERIEVKAPLQSLVDVKALAQELGVPDYVDVTNYQMMKATVALWAFRHPSEFIHELPDRPLRVGLFGGGGFRLHCSSANRGPFSRRIGDIDFVTVKENGEPMVEILSRLDEKCGTMFLHFLSSGDKRFNALRAGKRYRIRTIKGIDEEGLPISGLMDIFCDKLTFCHKLDVRDELNSLEEHFFTVGLENLLISKAQLIKIVGKAEATQVDENRILGDYDKKHILVGMETKDMQDVAAALVEHEIGQGHDRLNVDAMGRKLKQDWGMWKTVTMNLANMARRLGAIAVLFGVGEKERRVVEEKLSVVLEQLQGRYAAKKNFLRSNGQWWEEVEEQDLLPTSIS